MVVCLLPTTCTAIARHERSLSNNNLINIDILKDQT